MWWIAAILIVLAVILAVVLGVRFIWVPRLRARKGDLVVELLKIVGIPFARILHRARFVGWEKVPRRPGPNGLIIAANHTCGMDPVLLQYAIRPQIRWLVDDGMMPKWGKAFWKHQKAIAVNYGPGDAEALQEAIRHVHSGGVLGIFPEGGLERPREQVRPFLAGIGALVARGKAPVLLLWIHDTPKHEGCGRALFSFSRSVVEVVGLYDFTKDRDVRGIAARLQAELMRASGWPLNESAPPLSASQTARAQDRRAGPTSGPTAAPSPPPAPSSAAASSSPPERRSPPHRD